MDRFSVFADRWMGLCRRPPVIYISPAGIDNLPVSDHEGRPDGGAGGSGTAKRGIGAALSGMKTLARNPQLLWFSLLTGLVLTGLFIVQWLLFVHNIAQYIAEGLLFIDPYYAYFLLSLVLTIIVEFPTVFCLVFLLAGLVLSLSPENGGPVSFFHGLQRARKHAGSLTGWSVVVALAGTLFFIAGQNSFMLSTWIQPFNMIPTLWETVWGFPPDLLDQIPFRYLLYPDLYANLPFGDVWGFQIVLRSTLTETLVLSAINVLLFIPTLFVVPLIVLERKSLKEAVSGSPALMRRIGGEVAFCILCLGIAVCTALLVSLLYQGIFGTLILDTSWRAGNEWYAAGLMYVLALFCFTLIVATVGGIAALDLYTSAKTGQMPEPAGADPTA